MVTTGSNDSDDMWDVSSIFWSFVHDMNHMEYDDLTLAHSYNAMSDASNSGQPILLDESLLVPIGRVPEGLLDELGGIAFDSTLRCYVFDDSNALFMGALQLLQSCASLCGDADRPTDKRADRLDTCVKRMHNTLSVFGAVAEFGALDMDKVD